MTTLSADIMEVCTFRVQIEGTCFVVVFVVVFVFVFVFVFFPMGQSYHIAI